MESAQETSQLGTGWIEFSERHARAASSDFARSVVQYFNSTLQAEARANISHKDLLKKFLDCFSENFEYEYLRRSVQQGNSKVSLHSASQSPSDTNKKKVMNPTDEREEEEDEKNMGVVSKRKTSLFSPSFSARFSTTRNFTRLIAG